MNGGRKALDLVMYGTGGDPICDDLSDGYCTDYHCPGDCGMRGYGYQHQGNSAERNHKMLGLIERLRLIAAWNTPAGATPKTPQPDKMQTCNEAADELERLFQIAGEKRG